MGDLLLVTTIIEPVQTAEWFMQRCQTLDDRTGTFPEVFYDDMIVTFVNMGELKLSESQEQ